MDLEDVDVRLDTIPVGAVFELLSRPFVGKVIRKALAFRSKAPQSVHQPLDAAIRRSVTIRGFRDASKAPAKQLATSLHEEIDHCNGRLAAAILHVWVEAQAKWRPLVVDFLKEENVAVAADPKCDELQATWRRAEWEDLRDRLVAKHDRLGEEEAGLMLCLTAGRLLRADETLDELTSPRLLRWLDELERLPNDAPEWREASLFADMVVDVAQKKVEALIDGRVSGLRDGIGEANDKYKDELRYLGIDMDSWFEAASKRLAAIPEAEIIVAQLKDLLKAYRPIRPQAALRDEEKRRSEARDRYEREILKAVAVWDELMSQPAATEVADDHEEYVSDPIPLPEGAVAQQEFDELSTRFDKLEGEHEQLKTENARIDAENERLQLAETTLKEQILTLKHDLKSSKDNEQHWRRAFVGRKHSGASAATIERVSCANVNEAIEQAQKAFADELLFAPNGKSSKNYPFQKPGEVFDAFAWLATEFYRLRPNPGPSPDFDRLLKEACPGWSYKPNQTDTTMGMYPDWYKTTTGGKTYELPNHIGKGNSHDPKNTIRIAFAWDGDRKQVVVGYIGLHQRNRHS